MSQCCGVNFYLPAECIEPALAHALGHFWWEFKEADFSEEAAKVFWHRARGLDKLVLIGCNSHSRLVMCNKMTQIATLIGSKIGENPFMEKWG